MWRPLIPMSMQGGQDYKEASLLGSICRICQRIYFPFQPVCFACYSDEAVEPINLGRRGRLVKYTVATVAPAGFEPPHIQGFVELPGGVRVFSLLYGNNLKEGMEMELVPEVRGQEEDGTLLVCFRFKPLEVSR